MEVYLLLSDKKHIYGSKEDNKKSLSLYGAKGERIAFQILIKSPCKNVTASINENWKFEVFYEKYIPVLHPSCKFFKEGLYPDIMVDSNRAIKFRDNSSKNGQLLMWCFLDIPCNEKCHLKNIKVDIKDSESLESLYLEIKIFDFCMPVENHNRTSFVVSDEMIKGDKNEVIRKMENLIDLGLSYKLSPARILPWGQYPNSVLIDKIKQYTLDKRCANYSIPYVTYREKDVLTDNENECIDVNNLYSLLVDMVENSTNECNLFKKASFYITFIDEPTPDRFYKVRRVYRAIHDLKRKVVKKCDFSKKREVELSLLTMDNICTTFQKEPVYGEVDTWCPTYWGYRKPEYVYEEQALRKLGKKNWWYGCMGPLSPYPNLHLDSPMKDSRYESFLRYKFDIAGNLYWATNINKKYVDENTGYVDCDILKGETSFNGVNGDGTLFYTETEYGEPLPSLRVFSMYLGLQEYEYFYLFDNFVKKAVSYYNKNLNPRKMLKNIFTLISADSVLPYDFDCEYIRKELGERVSLAKDNVFVTSKETKGKRIIEIYSPKNYDVTLNNEKGKTIQCGNGVVTTFNIITNNLCEGIITYKKDGELKNTEKLLLFLKKVNIPFKNVRINNLKIKEEKYQSYLNIFVDRFVNEEKPSFTIDYKGDLSDIRKINFDIESFYGDAFILNAVLIDEYNNKFHAGYCVVDEKNEDTYSINVLNFAENHLTNVEEDIEFAKYDDKNKQKLKCFRFDKISSIELIIQNNIKLLDNNRERRISNYNFCIKDMYITLV